MKDAIEVESNVEDIVQPDIMDAEKVKEHRALVVAQFGDGKEYNKARIEEEIRVQSENVKRSFFEIGKKLILLKEHEPHGSFTESLGYLEISPRTARELMGVARKFIGENGAPKTATIAVLPPTKLYALSRLDDEDLLDLEEKGKIEGLTIKEVEEMTARELKERVKELKSENTRLKREALQDREVQESLLTDKNRRIDELDSKLRAVTDQSRWGEKAENYLNRLNHIIVQTNQSMTELAEILTGVEEMNVKEWEGSQEILYEQIKYIIEQVGTHVDAIGGRTDFLVPKGNAAFHTLHDLRAVRTSREEEGPDLV